MPLTVTNVVELKKAGCQLADPPELMIHLLVATRNNPCDGCAYFEDGKCPAYRKLHTDRGAKTAEEELRNVLNDNLIGGKWSGMTSKEIREKEGINREEFQKRKQRGDYKQ